MIITVEVGFRKFFKNKLKLNLLGWIWYCLVLPDDVLNRLLSSTCINFYLQSTSHYQTGITVVSREAPKTPLKKIRYRVVEKLNLIDLSVFRMSNLCNWKFKKKNWCQASECIWSKSALLEKQRSTTKTVAIPTEFCVQSQHPLVTSNFLKLMNSVKPNWADVYHLASLLLGDVFCSCGIVFACFYSR